MQLAREVLDKEILDCDGFKGGKVDDLLLELRGDEPPAVRAIVTQHGAVARQFGGAVAAASAWLQRTVLGLDPDVAPVEIGWEHVTRIDVTVHIDLGRGDANLCRTEQALWERWIRHLPLSQR